VLSDGLALHTQVKSQVQEQAQRQTQAQRTGPATAAATALSLRGRTAASSAQNNDAAVKANTVVQQLDHPWGRILYTLETETPAGMQWLLFDHHVNSPELRFEGVAPNSDMVLDTVNRLSGRRGWSEVVLSRLQAPDARASATPDPAAPMVPTAPTARAAVPATAARATKLAAPAQPPAAPPAPAAVEPSSPLWRFEIRAMVDARSALSSAERSLDSR
jgi:hypothetical protein